MFQESRSRESHLANEMQRKANDLLILLREIQVFRPPQDPRAFGHPPGDITYRYKALLKAVEGGNNLAARNGVAREFKELAVEITTEKWNDPDQRKQLVEAFVIRICDNACAALNARTNMTLHLGVKDKGQVTGIVIEHYELVS